MNIIRSFMTVAILVAISMTGCAAPRGEMTQKDAAMVKPVKERGIPWEISMVSAQARARAEGKPMLLDFFNPQ